MLATSDQGQNHVNALVPNSQSSILNIIFSLQAFQELQSKMIETTQKIKMADMQMETLRRSVVHAKLTEREIQGLEEDVRMYQGIGRM